jgi:hypothetical protein
MKRCLRGLTLFAFFASSLPMSAGVSQGTCQPSWIYLTKKAITVEAGPYEVKFSAILVGCEQQLSTLNERDLKKAQDALSNIIKRESLKLIGSASSKELRSEAAEEINRQLNRPAVSDIFFTSLSVGEYM